MPLWTEKYRPTSPDDLNCPQHIKTFLSSALKHGFPHLLLYGPPGTGKTSFASMLGPTLVLNASDDRGIDVVRNKIKKVANTVAAQTILLDECENLTRDSQTCLRRILEDYPTTRFIFCTNYHSRVIGPLRSRLLKIRFSTTSEAVERVGEKEGVGVARGVYKELFEKCGGDLRRCLNVLQGIKPLVGEAEVGEIVREALGEVRESVVEEFWGVASGGSKAFEERFQAEGYSVLQLIRQLSKGIGRVEGERRKAEVAQVLGECEYKCMIGCSEEVVLRYLIEATSRE